MKNRLAAPFFAFVLILISPLLSFGQDSTPDNLLANGDFEGGFVELDGAEPRKVADGWTPWHIPATDSSPSFVNHDPNYDEETDRIRLDEDGSAQMYFTLFATHQAGIYQEVDSVTSGTTYRFSVYAHVWSSSFEDADVSEDPGDVVVRVGIDPDGGTDGASEDIIWSSAATFFYDAYRQYAVIATAESTTITVFVESTVGGPRANNYIYLDDAVLEVASETLTEATPTSETNTELVGGNASETPSPSATPTATAASEQSEEQIPADSSDEEQPSPTPTATVIPTEPPTLTPSPTSTATLEPSATPTPSATADSGTPVSEARETVVHVVVDGDTVSALALQYGSTIGAINRANGLNEANVIFVGQRLIIPVSQAESAESDATVAPSNTPTATPTDTPTFTPTPTPTATPVTHQILPGDTLERIAGLYGTTVDLLAQQNNIVNVHQIDVGQILVIPTAVPPTPTPTPLPTATPIPTVTAAVDPGTVTTVTYVVQAGDSLGEIAAEFNTTVAAIVQLNGIANPSRIFPGQELQIPSASGVQTGASGSGPAATATPIPTPTPLPTAVPVAHIVRFGDTLYGIAVAYGVSVVELAQLNSITNYDQLSLGQVLIIPG